MGLTGKSKSTSEGWGMGFLLVFFPEDHNLLSSSSSSSTSTPLSSSFRLNTLLKRTDSTHLLSRARSTISICALLIFTTLLLFTLSTFEPTTSTHFTPRRHLSSSIHNTQKNSPRWSMSWLKRSSSNNKPAERDSSASSHALQGMGVLYRRGNKAMADLIVAHVTESVTLADLRLFLRLFHRSALSYKSDLLFIFPPKGIPFAAAAIQQENDFFLKFIQQVQLLNGTGVESMVSFDPSRLLKPGKKEKKVVEPIWGRRIRNNVTEQGDDESTHLSFGSVVGFEVDELDPENTLGGLLDNVPMSLRRWACYPMLLGRVRRNFKHVILVDVKDMILFGDPLGRVRSRSPESVFLSSTNQPTPSSKHGRKNLDKTQSIHQKPANPALVVGGVRGVRRLSNAMLTEIARAAMQHKRKGSVYEAGIFNQLVGNEFILKNVNLIRETESVAEVSSLAGLKSDSGSRLSLSGHTVVHRGNSNMDLNSIIMRHICSFPVDSLVYSDC